VIFQQTYKFLTQDLMGDRYFNFAPKFLQKWEIFSPLFCIF